MIRPTAFLAAASLLCLAAAHARALDCAKANSPTDKAICAAPAARAADDSMAAAYRVLFKRLAAPQRHGLALTQLEWLHRRDFACQGDADEGACLARFTRSRADLLAARPEAGPGTPDPLAPTFVGQAGRMGVTDVRISSLRFSPARGAGEADFNAAMDAIEKDVPRPTKDDFNRDKFAFQSDVRIAYASPALLSVHQSGYQYSGGAHPTSSATDVNVDLARGRKLTGGDLLGPAGLRAVARICTRSIADEKAKRLQSPAPTGDELAKLGKDVAATMAHLTSWSFGADAATVTFDPYSVGSYAEGFYECRLPYAALKPLAKPDFPLP
ncbi:MAG: DUF4163 domain-containing protein [Hyphomicrobiales bacterium]|nr:DUF4163 domain-containing protein [Hyphomicrobiales bacterium]